MIERLKYWLFRKARTVRAAACGADFMIYAAGTLWETLD